MEPVGLAVGLAGLCGLFSTCVECFTIFSKGRYLGQDYLILETKFANQSLRLVSWGQACGLLNRDSMTTQAMSHWSEDVCSRVEDTLNQIAGLLQNQKMLRKQYGLVGVEPSSATPKFSSMIGEVLPTISFKIGRLTSPRPQGEKRVNMIGATRWAINDRAKFFELVQHLKDFIDDLETLVPAPIIQHRQRDYIRAEIESIRDISELELMEEARMGNRDAISEAASFRICELQQQSNPERHVLDEEISQPQGWETIESVTIPDGPGGEMVYQVLHRVSCKLQPITIFIDPPNYTAGIQTDDQWFAIDADRPLQDPVSFHLAGSRTLPDIDSYTSQNTQLSFIVFKEYNCLHEGERSDACQESSESIHLISPDLCLLLRESLVKSDHYTFHPGMQLYSPHDWYFHNRHNIAENLRYISRGKSLDLENPPIDGDDRSSVAVAVVLLDYLHHSMEDHYQRFLSMLDLKRQVSWGNLPLLFPPHNLLVGKSPDGDGNFQGFRQTGPVKPIAADSYNIAQTLLIPATRYSMAGCVDGYREEPHVFDIDRSQFENGTQPMPLDMLPIVPSQYAQGCDEAHLYYCGKLCLQLLEQDRHIRYTDPASVDLCGEYIVDMCAYRRFHQTDTKKAYPDYTYDIDPDLYSDGDDNYSDYDHFDPEDSMDEYLECGSRYWVRRCLPHTIYGFHLEKHVWHRLLVRYIEIVEMNNDKEFKDLLDGFCEKDRILSLLTPRGTTSSSSSPRNPSALPSRSIICFQGPAAAMAVLAASQMTQRPIYRFRLNEYVGNMDAEFEAAKALNSRWGCIFVIEDPTISSASKAELQYSTIVQSLICFLDSFEGVVIFLSPFTKCYSSDPQISARIFMRLTFDINSNGYRKTIWRRVLNETIHSLGRPGTVSEDSLVGYATMGLPYDVRLEATKKVSEWFKPSENTKLTDDLDNW
ncbi:prion-inhibition and propagation-domain-containing protein [Dactylonectria macrodidyma]|uniref:Prion-inhibition and propagation-domain-containing protein n=1 Tax=Dactylonectria macrodidyma TaxID=307937 RepID=A0A9P9FPV1_9HYPO|nr:prion-inhibition and propagation-domain-containing protein [Dactylonectria macrodidyma]